MELVIFPVSARQFGIIDTLEGHAGVEDSFGGNRMGGYTSWSEAYFVTLIDRCSLIVDPGTGGVLYCVLVTETTLRN